jgi:hypothetical protein
MRPDGLLPAMTAEDMREAADGYAQAQDELVDAGTG